MQAAAIQIPEVCHQEVCAAGWEYSEANVFQFISQVLPLLLKGGAQSPANGLTIS